MRTIKEVMDIKICDFEFSVRCTNCMKTMGIKTLSDLTSRTREEITKMRNIGKKSIEEICNRLTTMGLTFQMTDYDWLQWGLAHIELVKML